MNRGGIKLLPVLLFGGYMLYYYFSNQQTVPLTGRKQLVDISKEQEAALGYQSYAQILRQEQVVRGTKEAALIQQIGQRLAAATREDGAGYQWEFNLINSDQINAFCLPGGKVAVYTGILPVAKNQNGLAAIMGHEIAHAIARHGAERMAQQKLVQLGTMAAGVAVSDMDPQMQRGVMGALGVGAQFGVLLPFSRNHESEADFMGIVYAARACYDPNEATQVWVRMGQVSGGGRQPAQFMSTHPSHETRIKQLEDWMPKALAERPSTCAAN